MRLSKTGLLFSLILHLALGLSLILLFKPHLDSLPMNTAKVENAYFAFLPKEQALITPATPMSLPLQQTKSDVARSQAKPAPAMISQQPERVAAPIAPTQSLAVTTAAPLAPKQIQQLLQLVAEQIQTHLQYPSLAETHVEQGQAILEFTLNAGGQLQNIETIQSSGVTSLDAAAVEAIKASSPIAIPAGIAIKQALTLRIPVQFSLRT